MCGIAGQFYFSKFKDNNFSIEKILEKMNFRGPDSKGIYENTNSNFGINRLAIKPISNNRMSAERMKSSIGFLFL